MREAKSKGVAFTAHDGPPPGAGPEVATAGSIWWTMWTRWTEWTQTAAARSSRPRRRARDRPAWDRLALAGVFAAGCFQHGGCRLPPLNKRCRIVFRRGSRHGARDRDSFLRHARL